jgi:hypothetical protein
MKIIMGNMQHLIGATNAMLTRVWIGLSQWHRVTEATFSGATASVIEKVLANIGLDQYFEAAGFTFNTCLLHKCSCKWCIGE